MPGAVVCVTSMNVTPPQPLIAVVDDEESVRRALARLIRTGSFDVEIFASGGEFLESLHGRRPDCVVLDVHMPGLTGRDVQRQLRRAQIQMPLIVVTAQDAPALREQCLADGAYAYLAKSEVGVRLINLIRDAINLRTAAP